MGGRATVVQRPGRPQRRVVPRDQPVEGRGAAAETPRRHVSVGKAGPTPTTTSRIPAESASERIHPLLGRHDGSGPGGSPKPLRAAQVAHPDWDDFWAARTPLLERIEVPAGARLRQLPRTRAFTHAAASKPSAASARATGSCTPTGAASGRPTIRRSPWPCNRASSTASSRARTTRCGTRLAYVSWRSARATTRSTPYAPSAPGPPPGLRWSSLHLAPGELRTTPFDARKTVSLDLPDGRASFAFRVPCGDGARGTDEAAAPGRARRRDGRPPLRRRCPRSWRTGRAALGGPFVFGCDVVARGWLRLAHRRVDELFAARSTGPSIPATGPSPSARANRTGRHRDPTPPRPASRGATSCASTSRAAG